MKISSLSSKQSLLALLLIIIAGSSVAIWWFLKLHPPVSTVQPDYPEQNGKQGQAKTYRNTEFGFEFQYPQDWEVRENTFGSYYSKFNMVTTPTVGRYSRFPVSVNIVLSEFPERSFQNVEKTTTKVTVDGVLGVKYQYEFEGSQETAIILPIGEYMIILGTDREQYVDIFNQIVSTFKFLK